MGEISEQILDGLMCEICGVWMEDCYTADGEFKAEIFNNPPGHTRTCEYCKIDYPDGPPDFIKRRS